MDSIVELLQGTNFTLWIAVFLSFAIFSLLRRRSPNLPPGPRGLPLVGYLPFLTREPHLKLHELSKKYGDIFGLYMGKTYVVVVSDNIIAREIFNKAVASNRPPDLFHTMPDGVGVSEFNGRKWVEQRRYTIQKMKDLGFGKSEWETLVQDEMLTLVDILRQTGGQPFDISKSLSASISNNIMSLVSGQRLPLGDPRRAVVDRGVETSQTLFVQSGLISLYPRLYWLSHKLGLIKSTEKLKDLEEMNKYIRNLVHQSKNSEDTHTYIQEYLKEMENNSQLNLKNSFSVNLTYFPILYVLPEVQNDIDNVSSFIEVNLIGNVQALIIAGSDTTKVSLLWLFLAMASYPDVQDKVHQELDRVLRKDDEPCGWVDRTKFPYCHATILEGQRWRTVVPLNLLHSTSSDITIRDYVIPKNSNIISLLWAFHNDDRHWTDPDAFKPERFLSQEGKVITKNESFAPFSFGKRTCIGETVALIELFVYFVGIMKRFRILPASESDPPHLKGTLGLTLQPPQQQLRYVAR